MSLERCKIILKTCGLYYLAGAAWILGIKYFYSLAGSDDLLWILTPTAWWVRTLGGLPFEYQPDLGYVNHSLRFVIASSCSGVQFMMILGAMLIFSLVHRLKNHTQRTIWLFGSLSASYIITILVNSLRILLAIYLPPLFTEAGLWNRFMTPERLHSMIGVVVYFSALLMVYGMVNNFFIFIGKSSDTTVEKTSYSLVAPLFWYLFIVLGLPFLNGAGIRNRQDFWEYALLIVAVCGGVMMVFGIIKRLEKCLDGKIGR